MSLNTGAAPIMGDMHDSQVLHGGDAEVLLSMKALLRLYKGSIKVLSRLCEGSGGDAEVLLSIKAL